MDMAVGKLKQAVEQSVKLCIDNDDTDKITDNILCLFYSTKWTLAKMYKLKTLLILLCILLNTLYVTDNVEDWRSFTGVFNLFHGTKETNTQTHSINICIWHVSQKWLLVAPFQWIRLIFGILRPSYVPTAAK